MILSERRCAGCGKAQQQARKLGGIMCVSLLTSAAKDAGIQLKAESDYWHLRCANLVRDKLLTGAQ